MEKRCYSVGKDNTTKETKVAGFAESIPPIRPMFQFPIMPTHLVEQFKAGEKTPELMQWIDRVAGGDSE